MHVAAGNVWLILGFCLGKVFIAVTGDQAAVDYSKLLRWLALGHPTANQCGISVIDQDISDAAGQKRKDSLLCAGNETRFRYEVFVELVFR